MGLLTQLNPRAKGGKEKEKEMEKTSMFLPVFQKRGGMSK